MRSHCIFIACLVLFAFCSMAQSEFSQGPDKCCFSFSNVRIPLKQVDTYHTTHVECHRRAVVFITKAPKEICANPSVRWVQRLMNLVDTRFLREVSESDRMIESIPLHQPEETALVLFKESQERKASESVRMIETTPLHKPEETTLVLFKESQDWKASESVRMIETTPLHKPEETTLVLFKESQERKASESVRMIDTTPLHKPEETTLVLFKESQDWKASDTVSMKLQSETTPLHQLEERGVVHFEESHNRSTHFCMQPG